MESNIKISLQEAEKYFNNKDYEKCLDYLSKLEDNKTVENNKAIIKFLIDKNLDNLFYNLIIPDDDNLEQSIITQYNRALAYAKYTLDVDQAISILENLIKLINSKLQIINEKIRYKPHFLLATIFIEKNLRLKKAWDLLHKIENNCPKKHFPKKFYYLKFRCAAEMSKTVTELEDIMNNANFTDKGKH